MIRVSSNGAAGKFLDGYSRRLKDVPKKLLRPAGNILLDETKKSVRQNLNKNASGDLEESFDVVIGTDSVAVVSDLPYARIHDVGGTIYPKHGQALTVPINPIAEGRTAREFGSLLFRPKNTNVLAIKINADEFVPIFALVESVTIRATRYLEKARRNARARLNELVKTSLELASELSRREVA